MGNIIGSHSRRDSCGATYIMVRFLKLLIGFLLAFPASLLFFVTLVFQPIGMTEAAAFRGKAGVLAVSLFTFTIGAYIIYKSLKSRSKNAGFPSSFIYKMYVTDDSVTYQYKTIFQYALIIPLIAGFLGGVVLQSTSVVAIAGGYIVLFGGLTALSAYPVQRLISKSAKASNITVSGSKWSFAQPLIITFKRA